MVIREWIEKPDELWDNSVESLTVSKNRNLIINTGWVTTVYDGYTFQHHPWPNHLGNIYETAAGELWSKWIGQDGQYGVQTLDQDRWIPYPIPEIKGINDENELSILPLSADSFLILTPLQLLLFNPNTRHTESLLTVDETHVNQFSQIIKGLDLDIWIAGIHGILKLTLAPHLERSFLNWEEYPLPAKLGIQNLNHVKVCPDGELLGSAESETLQRNVLVQFIDSKWSVVDIPTTEDVQCGWRDLEENLWIIQGPEGERELIQYSPNYEIQHKKQVYSFNNFFVDPRGSFYVPLSLVRYAPATWRIPREIENMKNPPPVHQILEDEKKQIWFACQKSLLLYDNKTWTEYEYPSNLQSWYASRYSFVKIPDGRLLILVREEIEDITRYELIDFKILAFNPSTKQFEFIAHPEGRQIRFIASKNDGNAWIVSRQSKNSDSYRVEIFDGKTFQTVAGMEYIDNLGESFNCIHELENGAIWIGGYKGKGFFANGKFHVVSKLTSDKDVGLSRILELMDHRTWVGASNIRELINPGVEDLGLLEWIYIKEGLGHINDMFQDAKDQSIWVASPNGLHRFKNECWTYIDFQNGPFTYLHALYDDSQNRIWAGSLEGPCLYYPEADPDPPIAYMAAKFGISNVTEIAPNGNAQFVFGGIDKWKYSKSDWLYFSHKVDNGAWSEYSPDTYAYYKGINTGKHTFYVKAMDRNWNVSDPVTWDFEVLKPWYKEPGFLGITIAGIIIILLLIRVAIQHHEKINKYAHQLALSNEDLNLMNAELQEANAQLLELDRMKSAFISQASHDLRTPLTAIKSSMDNILRGVGGKPNEKHHNLIHRSLRSVERLTHLIDDVLDINRIESGRMVLEKNDVHFESIVKNVIHEYQPATEQKKLAIKTSGLNESYPINVDVGKMERVVGELIGNAIKYTPEKGCVDVNLKKEDNQVVLTVRDSGIGMTKEECDKIWERFYRTKASQKFAKGSGLGLSIAKELVEMHEGTLSLVSAINEGSTFSLTLPIKEKEDNNHAGSEDSYR